MLKQSSPPRLKAQPCKPAQLRALVKHSEESPPMRLEEAAGYFSSRLPKVFRVIEGVDSPKGSEGVQLAKGDIFIVCLKKEGSFLKLKSESACVTVPFDTRTEFALTPLSEEDNDAAVKSWEGKFHSVTEFFEARKSQNIPMPAALKVLTNVLDHGRRKVPARTILFNIRQINQRVGLRKRYGIEGVDSSGLVHRFLEGEDPLHFSTKLFDTKCSPVYFANVLNFPKTARVYLHPSTDGEEEETKLLPNLSTTTITEVTHDHHLVVQKLSDDGNQLGPTFTVPLNACLKVVAIKLKDSALLDSISDQRCIGRATSSHSVGPTASLADRHMNPYSDVSPYSDMNPYSDDPSKATRGGIQVGKKGDQETYYNEGSARRVRQHVYVNVAGTVTTLPSPASTDTAAAYGSVLHHTREGLVFPKEPDIDIKGESQLSVVWEGVVSPLVTTKCEDAIYEEIEEDAFTQQRTVKSDHKLPQPQPSRPSPPVSPACSDLSTKPKPKGVPSTAIPLVPAVSTPTRHPPPVSKKPIMLTLCPKEPELRFHVAARLGLDWRSVCSYLGLQHYQLDQADEAHAKLEEKAMEALVMWLQGQGDSRVPRSWSTLLQALCRAGHSDMASDIKSCMKNETLGVMLPMSAPQVPRKLTPHSAVTTVPSPASTDTAAIYGSVLHHTREGLVFPKEPDIDIKASEVALHDLCWIPLGVQIQSAGPEGRRLPLAGPMEGGGRTIHLEVPPGAVGPSVTLEVHSAVIPNGPFALPEGYQFGSHVVYIYFDGRHVTSPLHLHLPHWYGGQDQVQDGLSFAMAPHTLKEGESVYHFELLEGGRFLSNFGELEIDGHCSLFAEVFKKGATSRYQAITLQKEERNKTTCDVAVMYATPLWCEILMKYRTGRRGWTVSNPSCPFTLQEGRIRGLLKEEHGNGWHAVINGSHELEPCHLEYDYHGITSPKLLEMAVNNRGYPPAITCVVLYQEELRRTGKPVCVVLDLLGADNELSFMCKAYEQADRNAAAAAPQSPQASSTDVMADWYPTVPNEIEPAPRHSLNQKPTMRSLDEKLVVHVAGKWDSTGLRLNIEDHVLQAIRTPNGSSDEHCREMLRRWLNGEQGCGNLPRTWSSVLDAVEIGCGSEVRRSIEELL